MVVVVTALVLTVSAIDSTWTVVATCWYQGMLVQYIQCVLTRTRNQARCNSSPITHLFRGGGGSVVGVGGSVGRGGCAGRGGAALPARRTGLPCRPRRRRFQLVCLHVGWADAGVDTAPALVLSACEAHQGRAGAARINQIKVTVLPIHCMVFTPSSKTGLVGHNHTYTLHGVY